MFLLISRPILGWLVQFNTHWKADALMIPVQYSTVVSNKWVKSYKHFKHSLFNQKTSAGGNSKKSNWILVLIGDFLELLMEIFY